MLGSPHYMSPEQVLGTKALDHRADIWSLGVVLFKCLSARTPYDDRDTVGQIIVSVVQGSPPSVLEPVRLPTPHPASMAAAAASATAVRTPGRAKTRKVNLFLIVRVVRLSISASAGGAQRLF